MPELDMIYQMDAVEFLREIPDESVDLVFTDPPYSISNKAGKLFRDYRSGKNGDISMDFGEWDRPGAFDPIPFLVEAKRILAPNGSIIVWTSEQLYGVYRAWFQEEMYPKQLMVWIKTNPIPQFRKVGYRQATELMFWALKSKNRMTNPNFIFQGQREMLNVFYAPIVGGKERTKHKNQKPLSICEKIIRTHCREGGTVIDPFCGSGTIPVACYRCGRHFIGNDFDAGCLAWAEERLRKEGFYDGHERNVDGQTIRDLAG